MNGFGSRSVATTRVPGGHPVSVGGATFGGGHVSVIAGPCTVEDPVALRDVARHVQAAGAAALRGGVFKVRTSPHNYQGGGLSALRELVGAAREVGLPFFTEVNDPRQVADVAECADGLQIGARHMQNFPLLVEAAQGDNPVLAANAMDMLRTLNQPARTMPILLGVLAADHSANWPAAVKELARLNHPGAGEPLLQLALKAKSPEQQTAALLALTSVVDPPPSTLLALLPKIYTDDATLDAALTLANEAERTFEVDAYRITRQAVARAQEGLLRVESLS